MPLALPNFIFFDNACKLRAHMVRNSDNYFTSRSALVVDVFHFKSKHKATDTACQEFCNPAGYPELRNPDNTWVFNSSAAEQANSWFGLFHSIVREMTADKYNFFLDEVIQIRNHVQHKELARQGYAPVLRPLTVLRGE